MPEKLQLDSLRMKGMQIADAKYIGGYIWMSTYAHGLLQYDGAELINRFVGPEPIHNMPKDLTEICPDPVDKNKFWIGSRGGGLMLWDVNKGLEKVYTTNDGLPNNTIYCILPDRDGKIWCSTNKGIFRLDQAPGRLLLLKKRMGLRAMNLTGLINLRLGMDVWFLVAWMASLFLILRNLIRKKSMRTVPIQITSLQINNQVQNVGDAGSIIKDPLSTLMTISLPYNKSYLRIEFAALVV